MSFTTVCPVCGGFDQFPEERKGKTGPCKNCGTMFPLVPESRVLTPGEELEFPAVPRSEEMPSAFGRYTVIKKLGQGAMGVVYLAEDPKLNHRRVALKVPLKDYTRFQREASVAAQFHHPNFCPIHDVGEDNCVPFLVMSFIEGKTLDTLIVRGKPWDAREAVKLIQTAAIALAAAHQEKVIHRDLKPANLMIDFKGQLFLMDFGLARQIDASSPNSTADGTILGTAYYMPPEQAKGLVKEVDERSDLYSLGVIFYELLAGCRPFEGDYAWQVLSQVVGAEPTPPSELNPALDRKLEAIVQKAMAKKPDDRFASMDDFATALQAWLEAPGKSGSKLSHSKGRWIAAVVAFAALCFGVIFVTTDKRRIRLDPTPPKREEPSGPAPISPDVANRETKKAQSIVVPPSTSKVEGTFITNTLGMKLALIPVGEFAMGSDASDPDAIDEEKVNGQKHQVRISKPFYLGTTEVTVGQFRQFVEKAKPNFKTEAERDGKGGYGWNEAEGTFEPDPASTWKSPGFPQDDNHPVVNVSWNDAVAFCNGLSQLEGRKPCYDLEGGFLKEGNGYRLPTEAEWEFACRAGQTTRYSSGDDPESLATVGNVADATVKEKYPAWTFAIKARDGYVCTAPVGQFLANALGLFDMHGNVWEWCADDYDADYYPKSPTDDPLNLTKAAGRVYRGGGWGSTSRNCRSAFRFWNTPDYRSNYLGFRVARAP
jgi:eukaryotic-like serine/threonine-protein kinase